MALSSTRGSRCANSPSMPCQDALLCAFEAVLASNLFVTLPNRSLVEVRGYEGIQHSKVQNNKDKKEVETHLGRLEPALSDDADGWGEVPK